MTSKQTSVPIESAAMSMGRSAMWRAAAVGVVAGLASGLFGVGGGVIIVPALVLFAGFSQKLATGTSLTAIVPISTAGVIGYAVSGEVDWAAAGLVAFGAIAGALIGARALVRIDGSLLQVLFSLVMLGTALKMFFDEADGVARLELTLLVAFGLLLLGLSSGLLAGLLGVGGGIIIVPVLTLLFESPLVLAKGTSLAIIVPTAVVSTIRNRKMGLTAFSAGQVVGGAGVITALAASRLSLGLDPKVSSMLFATLIVIVAIRLGRTGWQARFARRDGCR